MAYRIVHLNSQNCDITNDIQSAEPFTDETLTGDLIRDYVAKTDIHPGDTLQIIEE